MSEDFQAPPGGEKQYWHDRRLDASRAAAPSTGQMAERPRQTWDRSAVAAVVTPLPPGTIPNLRHPIAAFVLVVLAVIFVGVGVLAASGQGALPLPPIRLASCAKPNSKLLGPRGARFAAAFPKGRVLGEGAEDIDQCGYVEQVGTVNPQRLNGFSVTAVFGPTTINADTYSGYAVTPSWVGPAAVAPVSLNGASGVEDARCDQQLDWCQGWLRASRGQAKWVVLAGGNGASLPRIEAFLRSFQPAG
jgi:hypothetical protein